MAGLKRNRLLVERAVEGPGERALRSGKRAVRSVTVNLAESPLGWLRARNMVDDRQFDAGEQLRADWERSQLSPSVTMRWDASPLGKRAWGSSAVSDPMTAQVAARARFDAAVAAIGPGLRDIAWRVICAGEGMRDAETALGWPARAGRLVLGMALDRLADFYRIV